MVSKATTEAVAGSAGSVLAMLATFPLKTISTQQALSTSSAAPSPTPHHDDAGSGQLLAMLRFLHTYNLSNLYVGLGPNLVENALSNGVYFYFYSRFRAQAVTWARRKQGGAVAPGQRVDIGVLASLAVATAAGACNQLATLPVSVVATRMQGYRALPGADKLTRPPTTWETVRSILREEGVAGFWKGLFPAMILLVNPAVQYMLYEQILNLLRKWKAHRLAAAAAKAAAAEEREAAEAAAADGAAAAAASDSETAAMLARRCSADSDDAMLEAAAGKASSNPEKLHAQQQQTASAAAHRKQQQQPLSPHQVQLSALEVFLAGALAKVGATVSTYPLIVVKQRLQASASSSKMAAVAGGFKPSTLGIIADTLTHEGPGGFFKGLRAKILQTALNAALMLMLKEELHGVSHRALTAVGEGISRLRGSAASGVAVAVEQQQPAAA